MPLVQLIYVSSACRDLSENELYDILESSIRHNTQQGITGVLLYTNGSFMQVIEGEEAAIEETYSRICDDDRHKGIFLLSKEAIAKRDFPRWAMGFRRLGRGELDPHPAYAPFLPNGFDAERIGAQPGAATEMLRQFSRA
ncbi:BLUF domain-containing protein [Zoogloea sp.]|uniref:BLUF domain-containing protein n=1 Tax=Zoogloea sp. TaxID=49181 RepID=UPI0035AF1D82